jgi:hypothetical protein
VTRRSFLRALGLGAASVAVAPYLPALTSAFPAPTLIEIDQRIALILRRLTTPVWTLPKAAVVERFFGPAGLVVKWEPLFPSASPVRSTYPGTPTEHSTCQ